jgi:serine/threonine protein phosphatase PrpC
MVRVVSFTEAGGRPHNEDAFEVHAHPDDPDCLVCVLADGQGGRAGGARAAQLACQVAAAAALRLSPDALTRSATWATILREADEAVAQASDAGFTTLIGCCVRGDALAGASSGDSAVLLISAGGSQELTAQQLKNPPVGSGVAMFVPFAARLTPPWSVLVMSDGVWKYCGWDRIVTEAASQRGQALIDALQAKARLRGSGRFQDDFTIVVFDGET